MDVAGEIDEEGKLLGFLTGVVEVLVPSASDSTITSRAGADRLCGRNRRFAHEVSMTNTCSTSLISQSAKCLRVFRGWHF